MSGLSDLQQNLVLCVLFAALGGVLEVLATACLAYPAARILQGFEWTIWQLKGCLAANITLQILSSLSGNLFATWFGPVSIVGPMFFAAQLLANLFLFWVVLGLESFSKEMQIGTYVIVIAVVLLLNSGPTVQEYSESFEELIARPVAATWSMLLLIGMFITGALVMKARLFSMERFVGRSVIFKFTVLLVARASAFALNLTTSKAFLMDTTVIGWTISVIIKVVSGAIYTMTIVVQSTAVEQNVFVPLNAAMTILINALTGMLVWDDWRVVQSWAGYVCVFLLLVLGCTLLLGDLSLLQETSPETFRGGTYAMAVLSNRQRLVNNLQTIGNRLSGSGRTSQDEEAAAPATLSARRQEAWSTVYETGRAVSEHFISTRTMRRKRNRVEVEERLSESRPVSGPIDCPKEVTTSQMETIPPIPSSLPEDFKIITNTCALSWWRPIKFLAEGSISDIHLVKRRNKFVPVRYKEKREVMELASRKTIFSREQIEDDEMGDDVMVLKSIIKSHIGKEEVQAEMRSEILVMSHLKHPNIVRLYEAFERRNHVYLIMEYCPGGNLANKNFNEQQSAEVTRKVLSALQYMHSKGVTHRDIKLENIMIDRSGEVKLIDFGLATKYQSEEYANLTDTVGTLYSMAPEVLEGTYYNYKADLWSVGVVTYLLLSKRQPFWGPTEPMVWPIRRRVMMDLILKCQYAPMDGEAWVAISQAAKYFVGSLLQYNPIDRPTASVALESKWIQAYAMVSGKTLENYSASTTRNVDQIEAVKTLRRASNCRRRAWRILTIKFSFPKIEQLETRLSDTDTTGQGYVGADDLLLHIQEVGESLLSEEDLDALKRDTSLLGKDFQIEYIDFIMEVKRGRKRNIMDQLFTVLDEMSNLDQVKVNTLVELVDKDVIPDEIREEFRQTVLFLGDFHGEDGTISTLLLLNFMEKRLARRETKRR